MIEYVDGSAQRSDFPWPPRYVESWRLEFDRRARAATFEGCSILDVGAGRRPTFDPDDRPLGTSYVGLDASAAELAKAPAGSYAESCAADVGVAQPELFGRFDLVVSWQVLEHVRPLSRALANMRLYLKPGGRLVAQLSGRYAAYALLNRWISHDVGGPVVAKVMRREPDSVFPAYYDGCYHSALARMLDDWSEVQIVPRYKGAAYFRFSSALQRAYLFYEEWARRGHADLATHYIVDAVR